LPKRLSPIFRDRDELPSSASLSDAVNEALAGSESLIVICSPDSAASRWVNEEIRTFRQFGRADQIFCFVVEGEPNSGDKNECFPPALTEAIGEYDGYREPVAADARPSGDGRRNAVLKIAAGLLNVGFDELKRRDLRRYQRRLAGVTVTSILIAAVTITLAVTATIARNEADLRRQQAEDLIGFMLGDLREELHEIERLDVFKSVGDKAMEYFALLDEEDESNYSLAQRAKNLRQIGEVRQDQGDLSAAFEAFVQSQRIMEELAGRDADDPEIQIGLANSHFYVGFVHWDRGELQQARQQFEQVLPIVDKLRAAQPANTAWLIESTYAYTNLGRVLELDGLLLDALSAYEEVMAINRSLAKLEPNNPEWTLEVGFAHNNLGKLATSLGRLAEAEVHYREDLAIKTQLLNNNPDHNLWRSYKAVSEYFLGRLLANSGRFDEGVEYLESALESFQQLGQMDPQQTSFRQRRAAVERDLGEILLLHGEVDAATTLVDSSKKLFGELLLSDKSSSRWRHGLAGSLLVAAAIDSSQSDYLGAKEFLDEAGLQIRMLLEQEPSNRDSQQLAIRENLLTAQLQGDNDPQVAESAIIDAMDRLEKYFPDSANPWVLELKMGALVLLGRVGEADEIKRRLRDMGFRQWDRS
jgi:tetratricopeptide (TPR) repeat protein